MIGDRIDPFVDITEKPIFLKRIPALLVCIF